MATIESVRRGLDVLALGEFFERDSDVFAGHGSARRDLAGFDRLLARELPGEVLAQPDWMGARLTAAAFVAPAAVPLVATSEHPMRRRSHEGRDYRSPIWCCTSQ